MEFRHSKLPLWVSRPTDPPTQCRRRHLRSISKDALVTLYVASSSDLNCTPSVRRRSSVATEEVSCDLLRAPAAANTSISVEHIGWVADPPLWIQQMEEDVVNTEAEEVDGAALGPSERPPMWLQCVDRNQIHYEQVPYLTDW